MLIDIKMFVCLCVDIRMCLRECELKERWYCYSKLVFYCIHPYSFLVGRFDFLSKVEAKVCSRNKGREHEKHKNYTLWDTIFSDQVKSLRTVDVALRKYAFRNLISNLKKFLSNK